MSIQKEELDRINLLLSNVRDPEIGLSITKLGMVQSVDKEGNSLKINIKLTVPGCPLSSTIDKDIKKALEGLGYDSIEVDFGYMSKQELEDVKKMLAQTQQKTPYSIERYEKRKIKNIVAVYSAKGGVGKSTAVALLALVSASKGYKTGVLDCDISGPSMTTILPVGEKAKAVSNDKLEPADSRGIKLMSVDMLTDAEALIWRGPLVSSAIKQMYNDTDWGELDVLFIDLPPGTSDGPLTVFQSIPVDKIVIITTPQSLSNLIGKKTKLMADALKIPVSGVIKNMSYMRCPKCGEKIEIAENKGELQLPILAELPFLNKVDSGVGSLLDGEVKEQLSKAVDYLLS